MKIIQAENLTKKYKKIQKAGRNDRKYQRGYSTENMKKKQLWMLLI